MKKRRNKRRNKKLPKNKILFGAGIIIGILMIVYIGFSVFFINNYYIGTIINGENYSFMSPKWAKTKLIEEIADYKLEITGRNGQKDVIDGDSIGLEHLFDNTLEEVSKKQNGWGWIVGLFQEQNYELPKMVTFDEAALEEKIQNLVFFERENKAAPKDAYIKKYSNDSGKYELVEEDRGSTLIKDITNSAIKEAVKKLDEAFNLEEGDCYEKPELTKDNKDLVHVYNTLNKYVGAAITYDFIVTTEIVSGEQISEWLTFNSREVTIDEEKVREFVNALAKEHDTYGRTKKFTTTDARELELPSAYGYKTDRAAETAQLIEEIKKGENITREPIYNYRGYIRDENGDIGNNYVEIDLGAQHLYVYQEGKVVEETDFVSGNLAKGNSTPAGVFGLTYKERDSILRGETYESHVKYWMPFNGNVGMHDASWRKQFGGDIYLSQGSHGCVNLPGDKAENIYGMLEKGMPIICYY